MKANDMLNALIFGGDGSSTINDMSTSGGKSDSGKVLAVNSNGKITPVNLTVGEGTVAVDSTLAVTGAAADANNSLPLGTLGSTDISTFYGALEVLITGLLTRYPGKGIGFITYPHYGVSEGHRTYVNAIKEACARYAIPVLDLYNTGTLNTMTSALSTTFYSDGLHPNELGHSVIARKVCAFLGTL